MRVQEVSIVMKQLVFERDNNGQLKARVIKNTGLQADGSTININDGLLEEALRAGIFQQKAFARGYNNIYYRCNSVTLLRVTENQVILIDSYLGSKTKEEDEFEFNDCNSDLAVVYNNSENDENKFINLGKLKSVENEDEVDPSSYTFTTYSASTAKANGRASISSGKAVYVGNGADNYVYWTINVDKTGKYCFGVNGAVSGTRTTYINANGVNVGSVTHQGNSWSTGFDVYTTVELQAGENIIKLYNNSGYAPDIYNIQLSNEFVTDNTFDLQLEAKYPKSYEIDTDLEMNYNLTLLFVSKEN